MSSKERESLKRGLSFHYVFSLSTPTVKWIKRILCLFWLPASVRLFLLFLVLSFADLTDRSPDADNCPSWEQLIDRGLRNSLAFSQTFLFLCQKDRCDKLARTSLLGILRNEFVPKTIFFFFMICVNCSAAKSAVTCSGCRIMIL